MCVCVFFFRLSIQNSIDTGLWLSKDIYIVAPEDYTAIREGISMALWPNACQSPTDLNLSIQPRFLLGCSANRLTAF